MLNRGLAVLPDGGGIRIRVCLQAYREGAS
jgi:hypothetical protein